MVSPQWRVSRLVLAVLLAAAGPAAAQGWGDSPHLVVTDAQWTSGVKARLPVDDLGDSAGTRPLTLWLEVQGDAQAVEQIRRRGGIPITLQWLRFTEADGVASAVPVGRSRLTIGDHAVAGALAAEVDRTGTFTWRSWAQQASIRPGRWAVQVLGPQGELLDCMLPGEVVRPCRLGITLDGRAMRAGRYVK